VTKKKPEAPAASSPLERLNISAGETRAETIVGDAGGAYGASGFV
jgi:hypothetical protein